MDPRLPVQTFSMLPFHSSNVCHVGHSILFPKMTLCSRLFMCNLPRVSGQCHPSRRSNTSVVNSKCKSHLNVLQPSFILLLILLHFSCPTYKYWSYFVCLSRLLQIIRSVLLKRFTLPSLIVNHGKLQSVFRSCIKFLYNLPCTSLL